MKTHCVIPWRELAEPCYNMVAHPEVQLAAIDFLMESSRPYRTPGRWGALGVTGLLNSSSGATNQHKAGWFLGGHHDWYKVKRICQDTITTAMLTHRYGAPAWRLQQGIAPERKLRIQGPLGQDENSCRKAWERLQALEGKKIIPLNPCHRRAVKLTFEGLQLCPPIYPPEQVGPENPEGAWKKRPRDWRIRFRVCLEGSSWELDFLCGDRSEWKTPKWYKPPQGISDFSWKRGRKETLTQWFNRTAGFVESLLQTP